MTTPTQINPVPGPRGNLFAGSGPELNRKGLFAFFIDYWRTYGDLARVWLGPNMHTVVSHPDYQQHVLQGSRQTYGKGRGFAPIRLLTGEGLLTTEYERWQPRRRLVQPPFTAKSVLQFAQGITDCALSLHPTWDQLSNSGEVIDLNQSMKDLAMLIFSSIVLKVEVGEDMRMVSRNFTYMIDFVTRRIVAPIQLPMSLPLVEHRRFNEAKRAVDSLVDRLIDECKRSPDDSLLVSILMHAQDSETGITLTPTELHDELLTMFFAGYETTAQTLTWIWYLLAQHPEAEACLHDELATVLGGRMPTFEDLPRLKYTRMVMDEALRLYPPVWINNREVLIEDEIAGVKMPKGSLVFMLPYIAHRHPDYWPDPDSFIPERFASENTYNSDAYIPFGGGPRSCIGNHFAMLEVQLVLAALAQTYSVRLASGASVEVVSHGTLHPKGGLPMTIHKR